MRNMFILFMIGLLMFAAPVMASVDNHLLALQEVGLADFDIESNDHFVNFDNDDTPDLAITSFETDWKLINSGPSGQSSDNALSVDAFAGLEVLAAHYCMRRVATGTGL